jgi:hypothetical protein
MSESAGKGVDIEKIVKFASETGRNYYLTVLAVLMDWRTKYSGDGPDEQTPDAVLTAMDGRTYSFVAINVFLALTCFIAAAGTNGKPIELTIALVIPIFVLWTALAAALHWIAGLFGSEKPFLETLAVCMRVLSLALFLAGAVSLTAVVLFKPFFKSYDPRVVAGVLFLAIQTTFLAVYLPAGMRRVHGGSIFFHVVVAALIVAWTVLVNKDVLNDPRRVPMAPIIPAPTPTRTPAPSPEPAPTPHLTPTPTPTESSSAPSPSPTPTPSSSPTDTPSQPATPSPAPTSRKDADDGPPQKLVFPRSKCVVFRRRELNHCSWWNDLDSKLDHLVLCERSRFLHTDEIIRSGDWPPMDQCGYLSDYVRHQDWPKMCSVSSGSTVSFCYVEGLLSK